MPNKPKTFTKGQLVVVYWEHGLNSEEPTTDNTFAHVIEVNQGSCRVRFLDGFYGTIENERLVASPSPVRQVQCLRLAEIEMEIED